MTRSPQPRSMRRPARRQGETRTGAFAREPATQRLANVSAYCAVQPPSILKAAPFDFICGRSGEEERKPRHLLDLQNCLVGCAASSTSLITCFSVMPRAFAVSGICFSTKGVRT